MHASMRLPMASTLLQMGLCVAVHETLCGSEALGCINTIKISCNRQCQGLRIKVGEAGASQELHRKKTATEDLSANHDGGTHQTRLGMA